MHETQERTYLTDDKDFDHQVKLHMDIGGNGDYYIYTSWVVDTKGTRHLGLGSALAADVLQ